MGDSSAPSSPRRVPAGEKANAPATNVRVKNTASPIAGNRASNGNRNPTGPR